MDWLNNLETADVIQLLGISVALILGVISIFIAIFTLKQNSNMIENSTRPYMVITHEVTVTPFNMAYFIIKNCGQSYAEVISILCSENIKESIWCDDISVADEFNKLQNLVFAPNQKIAIACPSQSYKGDIASFEIRYKCGKKIYNDTFSINARNNSSLLRDKTSTFTV